MLHVLGSLQRWTTWETSPCISRHCMNIIHSYYLYSLYSYTHLIYHDLIIRTSNFTTTSQTKKTMTTLQWFPLVEKKGSFQKTHLPFQRPLSFPNSLLLDLLHFEVPTFGGFFGAKKCWGIFLETKKSMYIGVSNNSGTPKWMVYNGKPY